MGQQCILCPPRPPLPPPRWLSAPCWAPRRASCAAASPFIGPDTVSAPLMLGGRPPSAPRHPLLCTSASPAPQPFRPSSVWGRNTSSTRPPTPPCSPPPPCTHWLQIEGKGGRWGGRGGAGRPPGLRWSQGAANVQQKAAEQRDVCAAEKRIELQTAPLQQTPTRPPTPALQRGIKHEGKELRVGRPCGVRMGGNRAAGQP